MRRDRPNELVRKSSYTEFSRKSQPDRQQKIVRDLSPLKGLAGLSPEQLGKLARRLRVRLFRKRAIISDGRQTTDSVYIMLSGIARLTSINRKNEQVLLEILGPGDVICIPPLLPDPRHSLECKAFTESEIGALSAQELVEIAGQQYEKFRLALRLTVGRWWALLVRQSHLLGQTMEERVAVALLDLVDRFGLPETRGMLINLGLSHRDIAELVGGSRPKVSVCLRRFALEGALVQERLRTVIVPEKLNAICGRASES